MDLLSAVLEFEKEFLLLLDHSLLLVDHGHQVFELNLLRLAVVWARVVNTALDSGVPALSGTFPSLDDGSVNISVKGVENKLPIIFDIDLDLIEDITTAFGAWLASGKKFTLFGLDLSERCSVHLVFQFENLGLGNLLVPVLDILLDGVKVLDLE